MIHEYRKKTTIKAEQFDGSAEMMDKYLIVVLGTLTRGKVIDGCPCVLKTKEGAMNLHLGDWIATGIDGEHWVIADDIFHRTYERCD